MFLWKLNLVFVYFCYQKQPKDIATKKIFYLFHIYIYLSDLQESDGGAIT